MVAALLNDAELEVSEVVANAAMNRQRNLTGGNSYTKELGFNPLDFLEERLAIRQEVSWLDLCCGTGRALIQAAESCDRKGLTARIKLAGVDLVPMFDPIPAHCSQVTFRNASVAKWQPAERFDLITCVHGLHYIGDKLGIIQSLAACLKPGGLLAAHLDCQNLRLEGKASSRGRIGRALRQAGFHYQAKRHLLTCHGPLDSRLPYEYLGADDGAGPNFTGQAAVDSYYSDLT